MGVTNAVLDSYNLIMHCFTLIFSELCALLLCFRSAYRHSHFVFFSQIYSDSVELEQVFLTARVQVEGMESELGPSDDEQAEVSTLVCKPDRDKGGREKEREGGSERE